MEAIQPVGYSPIVGVVFYAVRRMKLTFLARRSSNNKRVRVRLPFVRAFW